MANPEEMYRCQTVNCGYVYDPDRGDKKGKIAKGTAFADLPEDWSCPICGATKKSFRPPCRSRRCGLNIIDQRTISPPLHTLQ
ncbi:MAG: rubredoxin [Desulfoplanes sp.]|nr:rubredoxin [Desulfoplanes sp.]